MNTLTSDNDLFKTLVLENISPQCRNESNFKTAYEINQFEKSNIMEASINDCSLQEIYQTKSDIMECNVEDCNSVLNVNEQIISSLLDLKRHITSALQKCEKKLIVIETSLQKHSGGDAKILICNAGIPYFKDRNYFFPPKNEDEILKENWKELQLRNLPKVCSWTIKERNVLLKAIKEEAIADVLRSQKTDCTTVDGLTVKSIIKVEEERKEDKTFPPTDFSEIVGPLEKKEFDWFKISSIHFDDIHSPLDCRVMWNVFLHPDINKNVWPKSEDVKLKEIVKKHKFQNWDKIAKDLSTNRTAYQCFIRYNTTKKLPKVQNYTWKSEEDERLLKLVDIFKIGDFIPWGEVANWIKNRTKQQVYFRWTYSLSPYLIKGRFTKAEDKLLKDAVIKYGTNFRKISAALMPNRSTVQLHDRYEILISNQIEKRKVWTFAEDSKLLDLFARFGPNWSRIAKAFSSKTRTQLRHRHTALQKYIKRGISLPELHRNQFPTINKTRNKQREEISYKDTLDQIMNPSNEHNDNNIDTELIKYFYTKQKATLVHKNKLYTTEQLSHDTKKLYSILQQLHAKLRIPDNIANIKLTDKDQQLLYSLKEYAKLKSDTEKRFQVIDECSLRMFGTNHDKREDSHFIPPPPSDSQIKLKSSKSVESKCIDYNLNTNDKFLVDKPAEMSTPDFVISHIGGHEQQLQFQKLNRLFQVTDVADKQSYLRNASIRPTKIFLLQQNNNNLTDRRDSSGNDKLTEIGTMVRSECNDTAISFERKSVDARRHVKLQSDYHRKSRMETVKKNYALFTMPEEIRYSSSTSETEITTEKDVSVIEATYATMLSFKNLIHLKRFNESYIGSNQFLTQQSYRFQEAIKLLETRLEQLFRYPIGLSKTALPEVYVIDTTENTNSNGKSSDVSKIKKLQTFDKSNKDVS